MRGRPASATSSSSRARGRGSASATSRASREDEAAALVARARARRALPRPRRPRLALWGRARGARAARLGRRLRVARAGPRRGAAPRRALAPRGRARRRARRGAQPSWRCRSRCPLRPTCARSTPGSGSSPTTPRPGSPWASTRSRCLRPELARGLARCDELAATPDRSSIAVAGMVVARQRPATAKGVVFMLLEDERGVVNVIVPPPVYERCRLAVRTAVVRRRQRPPRAPRERPQPGRRLGRAARGPRRRRRRRGPPDRAAGAPGDRSRPRPRRRPAGRARRRRRRRASARNRRRGAAAAQLRKPMNKPNQTPMQDRLQNICSVRART